MEVSRVAPAGLSYEEWVLLFTSELIRLRPHTPPRFARMAAQQSYGEGSMRPGDAAQRYHLRGDPTAQPNDWSMTRAGARSSAQIDCCLEAESSGRRVA